MTVVVTDWSATRILTGFGVEVDATPVAAATMPDHVWQNAGRINLKVEVRVHVGRDLSRGNDPA